MQAKQTIKLITNGNMLRRDVKQISWFIIGQNVWGQPLLENIVLFLGSWANPISLF